MDESLATARVRLGVIGLGRAGLFALERWLGGGAVRVVAACDRDPEALRQAEGLCGRLTADTDEILDSREVDAVFVAVSRRDRGGLARRVVEAGKHLVVEPPLAADLREASSVLEAAEANGRRVVVWSPWREDVDYRTARGVLCSGVIGAARLLRFERWEPASLGAFEGEALAPAVVGLLDQLVSLAGRPVATVFAVGLPSGGLTAAVTFSDGVTAAVTWKTGSAARLDHGWAIDAERGGYATGRRWVRTDEGEVYEVPAEVPPELAFEESLAAAVAGGEPTVSAAESLRLVALSEAVARSLRTGRAEAVENVP